METNNNPVNPSQPLSANDIPNQMLNACQNNKLAKLLFYVLSAVIFMAIGVFGHGYFQNITSEKQLEIPETAFPTSTTSGINSGTPQNTEPPKESTTGIINSTTPQPAELFKEPTIAINANKIAIAGKAISFVIPNDLVAYTLGTGYDLMLFRSEQQKKSFTDCITSRVAGECNLYSLGLKITVLENPYNLRLDTFVDQNASQRNSGVNTGPFQKLRLGNYDVILRDSEGMGLLREIYLANESKIYFLQGNSFQDATYSMNQNLDLLNELVKNIVFN